MPQKYGFFEESSETAHDASARSHRALPNGGTVTKIPRTRAAELVPASPKEVVLKRLGKRRGGVVQALRTQHSPSARRSVVGTTRPWTSGKRAITDVIFVASTKPNVGSSLLRAATGAANCHGLGACCDD